MEPRVLNVVDFAVARVPELEALEAALGDDDFELARHLRRRTGSHLEKKRVTKNPKTPPTRRERRRSLVTSRSCHVDGPKRLLETHLWHAKRMRMALSDGFVLAQRRNDRGLRAAARSLKTHCVCCDLTYCRPFLVKDAHVHDVLRKLGRRQNAKTTKTTTTAAGGDDVEEQPKREEAEITRDIYIFDDSSSIGPATVYGATTTTTTTEHEGVRVTTHPRCRGRAMDVAREHFPGRVESVEGGVIFFELRGPKSQEILGKLTLRPTRVFARPRGFDLHYEPGGDGSRQWCDLIRAGAHAVGQEERRHLRGVELGVPTFPEDDDDDDRESDLIRRRADLLRLPDDDDDDDENKKDRRRQGLRVRLVTLDAGVPAEGDGLFEEVDEDTRLGTVTTGGLSWSLGRGAGIGIVDARAFRGLTPVPSLPLGTPAHAPGDRGDPTTGRRAVLRSTPTTTKKNQQPKDHAILLFPIFDDDDDDDVS